ncbi:hypothetical protein [Streptomyces lonarensis]|uniref:Uncharacterized protein n=1 Tax=Streptomyces lonarensis TaxID=700599 RepID=A0A7X6D4Q0_9ACTN|nr:hypothetical protein [Streptomyces lonarensis]NJQ08152.1 hypothetical protein [Streptomyces lonarensis]
MAIPREPNGRPLTMYTMSLNAALDYAKKALAEGLNVEIKDMDLRDTVTYRTFQESPVLGKYWAVGVTTDDSAMGYRSKSAHQILEAVDRTTPEEYGAIHTDDLVAVCRGVYSADPTHVNPS